MPAKKYVGVNSSGSLTEVTAIVSSAGASNDGDLVALDSTGRLDASVMPSGIGANITNLPATEALSAGDMVNIWSNAGTVSVRKADASTANQGRTIDGYVIASVANAGTAAVYTDTGTTVSGLSGLTPGSTYFLDTTGGITTTPPTTSGHTLQRAGKALSATTLRFDPSDPVTRA